MDNDLDSFQNLSLNERTGLTSLPSELLIQIFLELDIQSLMRCKQVRTRPRPMHTNFNEMLGL